MGHTANLDEFLKIYRDKLRTIVGNNSGRSMGKLISCPLYNDFDLRFRHGFTNFPMDNGATKPIQQATEVVKRAADVNVGNVDMPVFVGF